MNQLIYLENCFSTNDEVISRLTKNEITTVYTYNQTRGRAQYGNIWKVNPNENLAYTIAVNSNSIHINNTLLNYYTAIIVRDFLANLTNEEVKIKWPNDIILNGKKVCGILLEKIKQNNQEFYIIGIGINVLQTEFSQLPKAGSILSVTNLKFNLKEFSKQFNDYIVLRLANIDTEDGILKNYNNFLFRKDEITVFQNDKFRQNGIIKEADKNGFLSIDLENVGLKKFFHKEIEMLY